MFQCNIIDKLLKEVRKQETWTYLIAQELECKKCEEEYNIIEKIKNIMDSHLKNNRLEIHKEGKHLIFPLFLDVASFLEEIHKCIMCNLNVNELNYISNINHLYSCTVTLTYDNIFCDIEKKIKNENKEKTVEQMRSDKVVKSKIWDKTEIDEDDDPLKQLLLMDDVKKEPDSWPSECNSPTSKKR